MSAVRNYTIRKNRIRQGLMDGFLCRENEKICCIEDRPLHTLILKSIDSLEEGCRWGRLSLQKEADENMIFCVHAVASDNREFMRKGVLTGLDDFLLDEKEPFALKRLLFEQLGECRFMNQEDMLLYDLEGRYLFLLFEMTGCGKGILSRIRINRDADYFIKTFPQVYQEHNSFFHRFLSVFTSMYLDFAQEIDAAANLLDAETAPLPLLPVLGGWLGIDVSGNFLKEAQLRRLIKEAYQLNRIKGTKQALERLTEMILGERAVILERNMMQQYIPAGEQETYGRLYGTSPYDVTMLIGSEVELNQRAQLMFLLQQFKPVRSRMKIVFLTKNGFLDSYSYLDVNARIFIGRDAWLDEKYSIDDTVTMQ